MKQHTIQTLTALAVLGLALVPVGGAVFVLGFVTGDSPCVLCWQQRTGMVLIALAGLFVLRYGARPRYIGMAVLIAAWGLHMGVRHSAAHVVRDIGQGFSVEIMGAHTYVWSAFIFWACVVTMGALMLVLKQFEPEGRLRPLRPLESFAGWVFFAVVAANALQAFASTGPPPFMGQSDPVRFSFNPRRWVWSLEEWFPAPLSLRGRWAVERPALHSASAARSGPFADLPLLAVKSRMALSLPLRGPVTDMAYDAGGGRFLLTTPSGVYLADRSLGRILRYTILDPGYSVDIGRIAGAAFLDADTVMALGENKSFVILREGGARDPNRNYRYFLESFEAFDEITRSRLATIRAKMMYVSSLAYDPASKRLYTVSVPNSRVQRLVVSSFDRSDLTLSEEYTPALAAGSALAGATRSLGELFVTGLTIEERLMYAVSAAYGALLTIDLDSRSIIDAHRIEGLERPTGIASTGGELYIVTEDGAITVVDRPEMAASAPSAPPR